MSALSYDEIMLKFRGEHKSRMLGEAQRLAGINAAAVSVANLTANADFDRFLSYLQAALETLKVRDADLTRRLRDPTLVDPIETARVKAELIGVSAQALILENVIALPAALQRDGETARGLLERMEEPDAA